MLHIKYVPFSKTQQQPLHSVVDNNFLWFYVLFYFFFWTKCMVKRYSEIIVRCLKCSLIQLKMVWSVFIVTPSIDWDNIKKKLIKSEFNTTKLKLKSVRMCMFPSVCECAHVTVVRIFFHLQRGKHRHVFACVCLPLLPYPSWPCQCASLIPRLPLCGWDEN